MHDLVDRHIEQQSPPVRLLVWSMRQWLKGALSGRCVCQLIGGAFGSAGVPGAEEHFHQAMRILYNDTRVPLRFGSPESSRVAEHEAFMLAAIQSAAAGRAEEVRAISRSMVHADLEPAFSNAICALASAFEQAGHSLNA